jgi:hypothetical protein
MRALVLRRSFAVASSNHIIGDARVAIRWTVLCSSYNLTLQQPTEQQQIENWVLPITPNLSLEFHIVLTSVRQLLLTKEFLCSLGTWSTQRSPHLVEVYHRSSLSTNPEESDEAKVCSCSRSCGARHEIESMVWMPWVLKGCRICSGGCHGPAQTWHSFHVRINTTDLTPPTQFV